jgi:hypothetical protein
MLGKATLWEWGEGPKGGNLCVFLQPVLAFGEKLAEMLVPKIWETPGNGGGSERAIPSFFQAKSKACPVPRNGSSFSLLRGPNPLKNDVPNTILSLRERGGACERPSLVWMREPAPREDCNMAEIDPARVRELLHYDPETGDFCWRVRRGQRAKAGAIAGSITSDGYRKIVIDKVPHLAHRLAVVWMTGETPGGRVTHRNRKRSDNRWKNIGKRLEAARHPRDERGVCAPGVTFCRKTLKYKATIKGRYLGLFYTPKEAAAACAGHRASA